MPDSTAKSTDAATSEPVEQAPAAAPAAPAAAPAEVVAAPAATPPAAVADPTPVPDSAHVPQAQPRVVYVETPAPPRQKSNRLAGGALALLGGGAFAAALAISMFLLMVMIPRTLLGVAEGFGSYTASAYFWVPVLFFTLGFVVLALVLNRGGWWLYVLFSIVVGAFTYFASIGVLLLLERVVFMTGAQAEAAYWLLALDPRIILAALIGREVSLWMGLAIAARGRRVRARNVERRAAFDRELAHKKAEHERAASAAS